MARLGPFIGKRSLSAGGGAVNGALGRRERDVVILGGPFGRIGLK